MLSGTRFWFTTSSHLHDDYVADRARVLGEAAVVTHRQEARVLARGADDRLQLLQGEPNRFLEPDRLAPLQSLDGELGVAVVARGDEHEVDAFVGELNTGY